MGLADRDYARREPRGPGFGAGGLGGGLRMLSVTGWLLVINIGIFVIGGFMARSGIPVSVAHEAIGNADLDGALIEPQYRALDGTPVSEDVVRNNTAC